MDERADERRVEQKLKKQGGRRYVWFAVVPLFAWLLLSVILVVLQLVLKDFIGWGWLILIILLLGALGQGAGFLVYYLKGHHAELDEVVPYVTGSEATKRFIEHMRDNPYNNVNLRVFEGTRKILAIMTAGSGVNATEMHVQKFRDANPSKHTIYYGLMRARQPDMMSWYSVPHEMPLDEERFKLKEWTEDFAVSPTNYRETKITKSYPGIGEQLTEVTREPVSTSVRKEEGADKRESLEE